VEPMAQKRICVFCASSLGNDEAYAQAAAKMGLLLAKQGLGLVYGGGNNGLMGALADACLRAGGEVWGVIPQNLVDREFAHRGVQHLEVVQTMHQRKARMAELAKAFIALPGGVGTLEEIFEVLAWSQLGLHRKPAGILNVKGYYDPLLEFLGRARSQGFIPDDNQWLVEQDPGKMVEKILERMEVNS
jgi:uncharacterized protein (TIGR00730 family)